MSPYRKPVRGFFIWENFMHIRLQACTLRRHVYLTLFVLAQPMAQAAFGADAVSSDAALEIPVVQVNGKKDSTDGSAASGYRNSTATVGPLGDMSLLDTPYSINDTSGDLIENTESHSMADALKTNPTVFVAQSQLTDGRGMNDAFIRGFKPTYLRDGLYVNSYNMPLVADVERMEVLNGPSAFLYGYANPGGVIDYVTKKPVNTPQASVTTGTYAGGQVYAAADLGGPVEGADKRLTYRLNAYYSDGNTFIDRQSLSTNLFALDLDYRVTPDVELNPHFYHTEFREQGAQGQFLLRAGVAIPVAPDPAKLYGQPWTLNVVGSNQIGLGLTYRINDTFKFRADFNHSDMLWTDQNLNAKLIDNAGDYTEKFLFYGTEHYFANTGYAMLDAAFDAGGVHHDLSFGYWGSNESPDSANSSSQTLGTFSIGAPSYVDRPAIDTPNTQTDHEEWDYNSLLISDHIAFNNAWSVLLGVNDTFVYQLDKDTISNAVLQKFNQSKLSPGLSVIYKPSSSTAIHASYIEGLSFGEQAPATAANANQMLAPFASKEYEVGAKATIGQVDIAAALFQVDKVNSELNPLDNVYQEDGREIHRGLEFTATGKLTSRLILVGGFTVLDAYVDHASANPLTDGKIPLGVPEREARVYADYAVPDVLPGLFLSGAANYTGRAPTDVYNTQFLGGVATYDAGLRYETKIHGSKMQFILKANNLFDKNYWASYTSRNGLAFGEPRTVMASAKFSW